jgi:hypothetical protein
MTNTAPLVIDSAPLSNSQVFHSHRADVFYTVPLSEIRDAKARQHLDNLPLLLKREIQCPRSCCY